jgi:hypothetical protein
MIDDHDYAHGEALRKIDSTRGRKYLNVFDDVLGIRLEVYCRFGHTRAIDVQIRGREKHGGQLHKARIPQTWFGKPD